MIVGAMSVRLVVHGSRSLKEKRRVVKSLKDRIRNRFNVSVAEVDDLDLHQAATLGVVVVSGEKPFAESVLSKVVDLVRSCPYAHMVDYTTEVFGA